tara:strand:+ start:102 stop:689 length:588 start_codon:yes stop_codon:yes gene_type:complete
MAPFNNNKAESPKIKRQKTQEEKMAEAKETFRKISQKPLLEPKQLHSNSVAKQTVSSSGGLTPSERAEANRLQDSIKQSYMSRKSKRTGKFDPEQRKVVFYDKPLSDKENIREYEMEKGSNYIDFTEEGKAVVRPVPRGDDDIPVQSFIKSLDSSQYRGSFFSDLPEDYQDPGLTPGHPLNPFEGYGRAKNFRKN